MQELDAYARLVDPWFPPALHQINNFDVLGMRLSACYLTSCENDGTAYIGLEGLWELQSQFIYQRAIHIKPLGAAPGQAALIRIISQENQAIDNHYNYGSFKSFGLTRLIVPDNEIKEYLTYSFENQALLQIIFNYWQDGEGYVEHNPAIINFNEIANRLAEWEAWKITDEHLLLDRRILEAEGNAWMTIQEYWIAARARAWDSCKDESKNIEFLNKVDDVFKRLYEGNFRSRESIERFYGSQGNELKINKTQSMAIVAAVDAWILDKWSNADYSLMQLETIMRMLINSLKERKQAFRERKKILDSLVEKNHEKLEQCRADLLRTGLVRFNRKKQLRNNYLEFSEEKYRQKTQSIAHEFADKLFGDIIQAITKEIYEPLQLLNAKLLDRAHDHQNKITAFQKVAEEKQRLSETTIKFYNYPNIRTGVNTMRLDQELQKRQSSGLRHVIKDKFGGGINQSFLKTWLDEVSTPSTLKMIEESSQQNAASAHEVYCIRNPALYGVNILDELRQNYPQLVGLQQYINDLVSRTVPFISFAPNAPTPSAALVVTIPMEGADDAFKNQLIGFFQGACPAEMRCHIAYSSRMDEITLSSVRADFPLRSIRTLGDYKRFLDERIRENPARAKLSLYLKDNIEDQLHDLLPPSQDTQLNKLLCLIILGEALGLFRKEEINGIPRYYVLYNERRGFAEIPYHFPTKTIDLLKGTMDKECTLHDLESELREITTQHAVAERALSDKIEQLFEDERPMHAKRREVLRTNVRTQLETHVFKNQQNRIITPVSVKIRDQVNAALTIIDRKP